MQTELTTEQIQAKLEEYCHRMPEYISKSDLIRIEEDDLDESYFSIENNRYYNNTKMEYKLKPRQCNYCNRTPMSTQVLTKNIKTGRSICNICKFKK
jgi:hypothetical protein